MSRLSLTKVHVWLAALLFPAMILFLVTGALYTWGNTGKIDERVRTVALTAPLAADDETSFRRVAEAELKALGLDAPTGKARLRKNSSGTSFEWTGSRRDIVVEATDDPLAAKVTIKEASLHRTMVQLHKAKGGVLFKIYATLLAVALFLLVATGLLIGLKSPPFRRATMIGSATGLIAFIGVVLVS